MNIIEILAFIVPSAIFYAAPLIFTAIGGVFSERSGVVNIGLEGLMVIGAFVAIVFNLAFVDTFGSMTPWIALIVAMFISMIFSLFHAVASISFRADQIVSGVALNLLAVGLTLFLVKKLFDGHGQTEMIQERFSRINVPILSDIPIIGPIFFKNEYLTSFLAIAVAIVAWFVIYKTPFGLRLRAVGEHPMATDTMGISVNKLRYIAVMISGALAGLGGAVYSQILFTNKSGINRFSTFHLIIFLLYCVPIYHNHAGPSKKFRPVKLPSPAVQQISSTAFLSALHPFEHKLHGERHFIRNACYPTYRMSKND